MSLTRSALGAKASRSGRRMRPALVVVKGRRAVMDAAKVLSW